MELSERKKIILKAIIDDYVKTGEPVGSSTILNNYGVESSSATIRNECNELEKMGLLEKTHTSSGRVPSSKGYRYYVDSLMNKNVGGDLRYQLQQSLGNRNANIKDVLQKASDVLADVTNLVSIVTPEKNADEKLEHINVTMISETSAVVVLVTNKGNVQNKTFDLSDLGNANDFKWCIELLNERLKGSSVVELIEKLTFLKPILEEKLNEHEKMFQSFVATFMRLQETKGMHSGASNIMKHPDLNSDPQKIAKIINIIENHSIFEQMALNNQSILIGEETGVDDEVSVFKARYNANGETGVISLIGPKRSDYNQIKNSLDQIVGEIESFFEGEN